MEPNIGAVELISTLLDSGKYKEALSVPNEEQHINSFKDNCWDLISIILSKIQDDTIIIKPSLYGACEELLSAVVQMSAPEEALLEFIEQVEVAKNDAQFGIIMIPLQNLLKKLSVKRGRSLEWCLNSISTYIESIPVPEHQLDGKERLLMECDPNIRRITRVYSILPPFYTPFIKEIAAPESNIQTKQIITSFLISLLGKPLIYIDLEPESNAQSETRQCCTTILQDICTLEKNVLIFLEYVENCFIAGQKSESKASTMEHNDSPYEHKHKINSTTLAGLFYAVFSGHFQVPECAIPQVYSSEYIVRTTLFSVLHLLSFSEFGPLAKGIALCRALLDRLSNNVPIAFLLSPIHFNLSKKLVNIAIYSSFETIRKNAVNLIGYHVNKFEYKGRCMLIKYLIDVSNHSGMIGYAITLYKNSIDDAFKNPELPDCFTGAQLKVMVKKICHLPHGAKSDLVELADQIITSLNFLRYIAIKDTANLTSIKDCFPDIESDYLDMLRTGLNMSKAHYEIKLKDVEEGKTPSKDITINVGGNVLDNIPMENKKEIIHSALNAFHLIEGLVARLSECININKMQELTMDCQ